MIREEKERLLERFGVSKYDYDEKELLFAIMRELVEMREELVRLTLGTSAQSRF